MIMKKIFNKIKLKESEKGITLIALVIPSVNHFFQSLDMFIKSLVVDLPLFLIIISFPSTRNGIVNIKRNTLIKKLLLFKLKYICSKIINAYIKYTYPIPVNLFVFLTSFFMYSPPYYNLILYFLRISVKYYLD